MSHVFFGIQVAVQSPPHDPWRTQVARLVQQHQRDVAVADQRTLFGALANRLREAADRCRLGYWDFVPDGDAEYADWVRGIEDDSAETWAPDGSGARLDFVLVSLLFLLPTGSRAAVLAGERCDLPEAQWRRRATYRHLFETVAMLDFGSVREAAVYLIPGGARHAFSLRELQGDGYDYLLPVE